MIDWKKAFRGADWFHWTGITPAVSQGAAETCLEAVKTAKDMGLTVSCDLNYRKKLWKWGKTPSEVMPELVAMCDVSVGNEEDAEKVCGISAPRTDVTSGRIDPAAYEHVCRELAAMFPNLKIITVTLRGSLSASHNTWTGVLWHNDTMFASPTYEMIPIVDRVGGGDSFAAGLIYGLVSFGEDHQKVVNFAAAASCLKHSIHGDFNLASIAEVERLMEGDASGRVSR
jgi:2-dehydro-3-deoxygluconokinase